MFLPDRYFVATVMWRRTPMRTLTKKKSYAQEFWVPAPPPAPALPIIQSHTSPVSMLLIAPL